MGGELSVTDPVHSVWRSPCGRYTVALKKDCFDEMRQIARQYYPDEVGTALVGSYSDDGRQATVTALAPLTADSLGTRNGFRRGVQGLLGFFQRVFRSSSGREHYVGEWHSHPGGKPVPSGTDDANSLAIARDPSARCAECVLIIVALACGRDGDAVDTGVFVYSRTRGRVVLARELRQHT